MRTSVEPGESLNTTRIIAVGGGFGLFWSCFFFMLVRNAFPDSGAEEGVSWEHLALRIALFLGFAAAAFAVSRAAGSALSRRARRIAVVLSAFYVVDTLATGALAIGAGRLIAIDLASWAVLGAGLGALFFLWLPLLVQLRERELAAALALAASGGAVVCLALNLMAPMATILFLSLCVLASLAAAEALAREASAADAARAAAAGLVPGAPPTRPAGISLAESRKNAHLSWAFGVTNVVYGIVFGLGAGSLTQLEPTVGLAAAIAAVIAAGALAAGAFMVRSRGRVRQSSVLRMLFPVMVVALVPLSFFPGPVYALCNLLLLGCYVFLVLVSIGFELRGAAERHASPLFFVGMSQTTLAVGLAAGFALGLLPSVTGALDYKVLSGVALGLVVLLAVFVAFTQGRMVNAQATADVAVAEAKAAAEHAEQGRWRTRCDAVASEAKLSPRETEVFMLLAKGRGIEHIQNKLGISSHTVKSHMYNIYRKMGISSREELLDAIERR